MGGAIQAWHFSRRGVQTGYMGDNPPLPRPLLAFWRLIPMPFTQGFEVRDLRFLIGQVPRGRNGAARPASSRSALRAPGCPSAGLRPARCANRAGGAVRLPERSRRWESSLSREKLQRTSGAVRRGDVVCGVWWQVVLGPQLRGMLELPVRCDPAACEYAFVESALVCRQVPTTERCVANSTKASAVFGAGEPAAAEFA